MTEPLFIVDALDNLHPGCSISSVSGSVSLDDVPDLGGMSVGSELSLPESIRRHALSALRLHEADRLQLSDGRGLRVHTRVLDAAHGTVEIRAVEREPAPAVGIALVQALAKQGHDERAIDASTQIGVDSVVPWQANRSIAKWKRGKSDHKWLATIRASCEQSRRSWVPALEDCVDSKSLTMMCQRAASNGDVVLALHQDSDFTLAQAMQAVRSLVGDNSGNANHRTVFIIVGPEGGIDDDEIRGFGDAGAHCCVIGRNILRASTAGPVAITLVSQALGRFQ